jgi:hypothetical protein
LEDKVLGVGPVIWDLTGIVIAHDIRHLAHAPTSFLGSLRGDKAIHSAAVDVSDCCLRTVRAALVEVLRVVERRNTAMRYRIGHTDGRTSMVHGDAVRPWEGSEVVVEGAVLLHDHDHMLNLLEADRAGRLIGQWGRHVWEAAAGN